MPPPSEEAVLAVIRLFRRTRIAGPVQPQPNTGSNGLLKIPPPSPGLPKVPASFSPVQPLPNTGSNGLLKIPPPSPGSPKVPIAWFSAKRLFVIVMVPELDSPPPLPAPKETSPKDPPAWLPENVLFTIVAAPLKLL